MNPDAVVLEQVRAYWRNLFAILLYKLAKDGVIITPEDIKALDEANLVLLTHGHRDSFEFKFVSHEEAERIVEWNRSQSGHA